MPKALLFTSGDGRDSANAFWIQEHLEMVPKVEAAMCAVGLEPVWLHDPNIAINSPYMAREVGVQALERYERGDLLVNMTTGWNFPEHFGIVPTMCQDEISAGDLRLLLLCNMREKAPGYVAARANALIAEILEVDYDCLTIVDQSEVGWEKFRGYLDSVLSRDHDPVVPEAVIEIPESARGIAVQAITNIRHSGGIVPIINPSSMTMAQGWPNYYLWKYLGLTPIAIGSNEFRRDMDAVDENTLRGGYFWLQDHGLNFAFEDGGLCESEIFEALRMYYAKLSYYTRGAIAMGTQGQMDMTMVWPATDLSESLMMSTFSPGKDVPVVDVTESDCEALWTSILMQEIIRVKYGEEAPIGFHDVRHYNAEQDTLVLLNSGALALDFMTDSPGDYSDIWAVSQNRSVYFHHGGACIKGIMRADHDALMFRAHGKGNSYHMQGVRMNVLPLSWEERAQHYGELDPWPMGIVQTAGGTTREVTLNWIPNHSQHCAGEYQIMAEMFAACDELGVSRHCYGI